MTPFDFTDAACRGSAVPFFAPEHERVAARNERVAAAKAICARCPHLHDCRTWALANEPDHDAGDVWGGMDGNERRRHRYGIGRSGCGTLAGYARHRRNKTTPCADCYEAKATYERQLKADRRRNPDQPRKSGPPPQPRLPVDPLVQAIAYGHHGGQRITDAEASRTLGQRTNYLSAQRTVGGLTYLQAQRCADALGLALTDIWSAAEQQEAS